LKFNAGPDENLNTYIALALIVGIIAILAFTFYYEIQLSNNAANDKVSIPVVTVTATKIVYVNASSPATTCSNETSGNSTVSC
jgi:hypothetical protein